MIIIEINTIILALLCIALLSLSSLLIKYSLSIIDAKQKCKHIPGPEPKGIMGFFMGNLKDVTENEKKGVVLPELFTRVMAKYNSKTIKYRFANLNFVITSDTRLIKTILVDTNCRKNHVIANMLGFPGGIRAVGYGLITETNHEVWKEKRSLFNPGFHKKVLMEYLKEFNNKGDILMTHLKEAIEKKPNEPISLLKKFNQTTLDVIASVAFGFNVDSVNDPNNEFHKHITDVLEGFMRFLYDPFLQYNPFNWPFLYEYRKKINYLRAVGQKQLESRIEALKNGDPLPDDILTTILKQSENQNFSMDDMVDQFLTFFMAGQETTANTLASVFLELGRNRHVLEKLRNEIDTEIGSKVELSIDDLQKLKYTGCVFKEALRLYPAVPLIDRYNHEDIHGDGITIPKHSWILISPYVCARDPEYFPEPLKFEPERYLSEDSIIKNYTYLPFSMGPRTCIGQNFAKIEAKVLIAKFFQNFDFELEPNQTFDMHLAVTLRPKDGVKCVIRLR